MTSIERTAYPQFRRLTSARVLHVFFTPAAEEIGWAKERTAGQESLFALVNDSDIQPSTVHADTQGQSAPVFTLATLFGFDLVPRIRNFRDLIFFRASGHLIYPHIGELFGERGRNVIDWQLIERHWRDLMQVALSISEGRLASATLMRRLRADSRKNRIYKVFREVGRSVRTVALLRYLADPQLRARVTAATNKAESYHGFAQ
jgi:TnpA family transposase